MMTDASETLDGLVARLDSNDPRTRNVAAMRLRDFAESAVDAIFRAISRPDNRHYIGTLVFVLAVFDCGDHFSELFQLALHGDYEVQCHALSLLQNQGFSVSDEQLEEAKQALSELRERDGMSVNDVELLRGELQSILVRLEQS